MAQHPEVLIVGAGPTGLVLALWLTRQGVSVRIIDKSDGPGETSRAMAVQARTLELYRQLDLADAVVAGGHRAPGFNVWAKGRHRVRIPLTKTGESLTPYPFVLVYPQDRHEQLLVSRLQALGVSVERRTELVSFKEEGGQVTARLRSSNGMESVCAARYIAGCDGARSTVRHQLGATFQGGTYKQVFYVADVQLNGLQPADEVHMALDDADFVLVLPYGRSGECRLIGTVRGERADRGESLTFDDVTHDALHGLGLQVEAVRWFSTYRVHHRVTNRFRQGRAFLLGDAAHVHSPAGGQGMNTGILDAINLAWKLAAVIAGRAPDALLDSYAQERQAFARSLVDTTDRVFGFVTAEGAPANFVRTHMAPRLAGLLSRVDPLREFMFRTVSQTAVSYRDSALSEGTAGRVHAGDRLPWLPSPGLDNHGGLAHIAWQVHVYGTARPETKAWCQERRLALHEFLWQAGHGAVGLARDALYLLRPDTHVALADASGTLDALSRYFRRRGLVFSPSHRSTPVEADAGAA